MQDAPAWPLTGRVPGGHSSGSGGIASARTEPVIAAKRTIVTGRNWERDTDGA
ncbi:MAG: hypothetical protein U0234_25550 [Sandaracinus sp.]